MKNQISLAASVLFVPAKRWPNASAEQLQEAFISLKHKVFFFTEALASLTRCLGGGKRTRKDYISMPLNSNQVLVQHNKTKEALHLHLFPLQVIFQARGLGTGEAVICFSQCPAPE